MTPMGHLYSHNGPTEAHHSNHLPKNRSIAALPVCHHQHPIILHCRPKHLLLALSQTGLLFLSLPVWYQPFSATATHSNNKVILGVLLTLFLHDHSADIAIHALSLIALIIISGAGYFYTLINMNAFFIVKFSIVIIAFIDRSLPNLSAFMQSLSPLHSVASALISNTC